MGILFYLILPHHPIFEWKKNSIIALHGSLLGRLLSNERRQFMTLDLNFGQKVKIVSSHHHNNKQLTVGGLASCNHSLILQNGSYHILVSTSKRAILTEVVFSCLKVRDKILLSRNIQLETSLKLKIFTMGGKLT